MRFIIIIKQSLQLFLISSCSKNNLHVLQNTKKILHIQTVKETDFVSLLWAFCKWAFVLKRLLFPTIFGRDTCSITL